MENFIHNYCITNPATLRSLPMLKQAQFTLNSRMFPSKRTGTVLALETLKEYHNTTQIVIHYDYIYIISRYIFMAPEVQKAVITEINTLMHYAETKGDEIIGMIMHTDFPLKRDVYEKKGLSEDYIRESYKGTVWNTQLIVDYYKTCVSMDNCQDILINSFNKFYDDMKAVRNTFPFKIFIENTTKVPRMSYKGLQPGTIEFINDYLANNKEKQDLYGMCLDTEHAYAVKGPYNERLDWDCEILVHLNPVPVGVLPGSLKDQHSLTTLFECSVNTFEFYIDLIKRLKDKNIPFIRECYEETMQREWKQIEDYVRQ